MFLIYLQGEVIIGTVEFNFGDICSKKQEEEEKESNAKQNLLKKMQSSDCPLDEDGDVKSDSSVLSEPEHSETEIMNLKQPVRNLQGQLKGTLCLQVLYIFKMIRVFVRNERLLTVIIVTFSSPFEMRV